jgi:hypothetical protein
VILVIDHRGFCSIRALTIEMHLLLMLAVCPASRAVYLLSYNLDMLNPNTKTKPANMVTVMTRRQWASLTDNIAGISVRLHRSPTPSTLDLKRAVPLLIAFAVGASPTPEPATIWQLINETKKASYLLGACFLRRCPGH